MKQFVILIAATLGSMAFAQNIERISARQAEDILKYRAPTVAADLIGAWKKVLNGPTTQQLGYYDSNGIAEGNGNKVFNFTLGATDLSEWLPKEVSQVYFINPTIFMSPTFESSVINDKDVEILEQPRIIRMPKAAVHQVGESIRFRLETTYSVKYRRSYYSYPCYLNCGITFKIPKSDDYKDNLYIDVDYICALQIGNKDRLVCEQVANIYGRTFKHEFKQYFPNLIAFERVK